ncbi:PEP-CTERM sorting domain-containing protein [Verrucomicrobiaceae bacterium R5-34]|uniref:PEP-CTERM sorting domain-containing protein n=1 Tax=Oceaniferula flava TaxID=2800421 RepID=A0AAE2SAT1_9BACT|nr:PEP-CTERM sorting domain-containing protein [Oceaniferula flavus]MBK1830579.1 PEP-CTERM sorting domain-containing protein [Verrucomicrobiaceae bacterium R5-34]MBK1854675.1 PEP-CTERM sorting domain-containing protein [Oceaniferula flavus]MBM1135981.1 PEP-CTERM sorting domain-containing protein [Oceaniferula flavus]
MKTKHLYLLTGVSAALTLPCYSQVVVDDVFSYSGPGSAPGPVEATAVVGVNATETGVLGDGWDTSVEIGVGLLYYVAADMPGDGSFTISNGSNVGIGSVLTAATDVDARRVFSNTQLTSDGEYSFSITKSQSGTVNLLADIDIEIGHTDGVTDTVLVDTSTGTGLLGILDLVGLFGGTDTGTFNFDGADFGDEDLYIELRTDTVANALGSSVVFSDLSIERTNPVPEPSSSLFSIVAGGMMLGYRRRKSS